MKVKYRGQAVEGPDVYCVTVLGLAFSNWPVSLGLKKHIEGLAFLRMS